MTRIEGSHDDATAEQAGRTAATAASAAATTTGRLARDTHAGSARTSREVAESRAAAADGSSADGDGVAQPAVIVQYERMVATRGRVHRQRDGLFKGAAGIANGTADAITIVSL